MPENQPVAVDHITQALRIAERIASSLERIASVLISVDEKLHDLTYKGKGR